MKHSWFVRRPSLLVVAAVAVLAACGGVAPSDPRTPSDGTDLVSTAGEASGHWVITEASAREAGLLAVSFDLAERAGALAGRMALSGVTHPATGTRAGRRVELAIGGESGTPVMRFSGDLLDSRTMRGSLIATNGALTARITLERR